MRRAPPGITAVGGGGPRRVGDEVRGAISARTASPRRSPEPLGGIAAAEREQSVAGGIDVEPGLRRAHHDSSASAA